MKKFSSDYTPTEIIRDHAEEIAREALSNDCERVNIYWDGDRVSFTDPKKHERKVLIGGIQATDDYAWEEQFCGPIVHGADKTVDNENYSNYRVNCIDHNAIHAVNNGRIDHRTSIHGVFEEMVDDLTRDVKYNARGFVHSTAASMIDEEAEKDVHFEELVRLMAQPGYPGTLALIDGDEENDDLKRAATLYDELGVDWWYRHKVRRFRKKLEPLRELFW